MVEKESFYARVYPIYNKYYSLVELKELINFYNTPLGKKTLKVFPSVTKEVMQATMLWSKALGLEINKRLKMKFAEQGINLEKK